MTRRAPHDAASPDTTPHSGGPRDEASRPATPRDAAPSHPAMRIRDAGDEPLPRGTFAAVCLLLAVCALAAGLLIGIGTLIVLRLSHMLQDGLWEGLRDRLPEPARMLSPLALCLVGGLLVGAITRRAGYHLDTLSQVVATSRRDGDYRMRSIGWSLLLFLTPIAFGGAVGPEAGVAGFVTAGGYAASRALRRSGIAAVTTGGNALHAALSGFVHPSAFSAPSASAAPTAPSTPPDLRHYRYARIPTLVLWAIACAGFVLGLRWTAGWFGNATPMPRLEAISYRGATGRDWLVALVALAVGYALSLVMEASTVLTRRLMARMGESTVVKAVLTGAVLGVAGIALPDVLFSGQVQTTQLVADWRTRGWALLVAVCVVKIVMTTLCVAGGWIGGEFFPQIFCGIAAGYALALASGCDPALATAVTTAAFIGGCTHKPVLTAIVLALCFPPASLPIVLAAAAIGAALPTPFAPARRSTKGGGKNDGGKNDGGNEGGKNGGAA